MHWGLNRQGHSGQTTFPNTHSWKKIRKYLQFFLMWQQFILRVWLEISQQWFKQWLGSSSLPEPMLTYKQWWWSMTYINHSRASPIWWWCHQMEIFSALRAICEGKSPATGEFPAQRPVTRSFDACLNLRLNKKWSKQWWGWLFETPSSQL